MSTAQDQAPRRGGRPAKAAEDRKSAMLRFRVREDLKERVDAAAAEAGRSASEEAEARLDQSFELEKIIKLMFTNERAKDLFLNMTSVIGAVQDYQNPPGVALGSKEWVGDHAQGEYTRAAIRSALLILIQHSIPRPHKPEELPWPEAVRRRYADELQHMTEFGAELAQSFTGQRPDLVDALVRPDAAEH